MKELSRFTTPFLGAKSFLAMPWRRHKRDKRDLVNFFPFMQLPPELRLQIWRYHEPRIIELIAEGAGHWRTTMPPPAMLSVCRESRQEGQKVYQRLRLADSFNCPCRENYTYIDFSLDTIYIGNGCSEMRQLSALLRSQEQLQKNLLKLALQHRVWNHLVHVDRIGVIHSLEVVKELVVLCEGVESPGRRKSTIGYEKPPHIFPFQLTNMEESRLLAENWRFPVIKSYGITRDGLRNRVSTPPRDHRQADLDEAGDLTRSIQR